MAELVTQDSTNSQSASVGAELFNDSLNASPLLKTLTKRKVIAGTNFKGLRRTDSIPGGWRTIGTGVTRNGSTYVHVSVDLALYSNPVRIDDAFVKSVKGTQAIEDILVEESKSASEGALASIDASAFNTVANAPDSLVALADESQVYTVAEEADSDVEYTLAVFVKEPEVEVLFGGDDYLTFGEWQKQQIDVDGKTLTAHCNDLTAWIAYAPKSSKSIAVVKNIGMTGTDVFTDAVVAQVVSECKGMPYTHIFVNRKAVYQLQQSRKTDLIPTPAWPTESMGIALVVSDNIPGDLAFEDIEA